MIGSDRAEVSAIRCCYFVHVKSFGDCQDGGIDRTERKVGVLSNQLGHPQQIGTGEINEFDFLVGYRFQESGLSRRSDPGLQKIANFCENWTWDQ